MHLNRPLVLAGTTFLLITVGLVASWLRRAAPGASTPSRRFTPSSCYRRKPMNTPKTSTTIALLCLGSVVTALAQQNDDELKQRVLSQAQSVSADDYAFTRTIQSEATFLGKTAKVVSIEKFDPTKPAHARWTLVSVDGAPPSAAELRKYRKEAAKRRVVPGYHRIANYFGAPATVSSDAVGKRVLRFATLPKGSVSIKETDLSHLATAEASVTEEDGEPFVEQVRFTLKTRRAMLIDRYETTFRYRIGPGGKPFLAATTSDLFGSGLGLGAAMHSAITYSDYQAVRNSQRP